jgi:tungstate transport system substrate-binding protein
VIGAGTTIVDSGFADALADRYETADIAVVGGSSRELLALLDAGAIDVAITHHPEAEAEYLSEHPGVSSSVVFSSSFVFAADAAVADEGLRSLGITELLVRIASDGLTFVSRGDGSGTAAAEQRLWSAAGVNPGGEWYLETGQGMGFTLQVVDQLDGITLAELGAVVASVDRLDLVYWSPADLDNPYRATVGDDAPDAAGEFVEWLGGDGGAAIEELSEVLLGGAISVSR